MSRFRHLIAVALVAASGLIAYAGALRNGFVWDDRYQILQNPALHADQSWTALLTTDVWAYTRGGQAGTSNYYRPLPMLVYRAVMEAAGPDAAVFHGIGIAMNILAAWAAYWLMLLLTRRDGVALCGALLFVVHPIHSEAVFWIAGLAEVGCAFFYFLAFGFYLLAWRKPEDAGRKKRKRIAEKPQARVPFLAASLIAFLVALLWKEMALTLPIAIAACVFVTETDKTGSARARLAAARSAPFWITTVAYLGLRVAVLGHFSSPQHEWPLTPLAYALTAIDLLANYWLKLVAPVPLNAYHVFRPVRSLLDVRAIASLAFLLAAGIALVRGWRRWPLATLAAAWVFLTLLPVLNLRGVGANVFAQRYLYIPSLGFCLLIALAGAAAVQRLPPLARSWTAGIAVAVLVVAATVQVRARAADWQDDYSLLTATVRTSPRSAVMRNGLGHVLAEERRELDAAQAQYDLAYQYASEDSPPDKEQMANALVGLGGVYYWRHDFARSLQYLDRALAADPSFGSAHIARGLDLLALGRLDEAQAALTDAHRVYPNDAVVANGLGMVAMARHDFNAAISYFSEAVALVPDYFDGYANLGRALLEANRVDEAAAALRHACELSPDNAPAHAFYGSALARLGRYDQARGEFERALGIDPSFEWARQNLQQLDQMEAQPHR